MSHRLHDSAPRDVLDEKVPYAHVWQKKAPRAEAYEPAKHGEQVVRPGVAAMVPKAHRLHAVLPLTDE